MLRAPQSIRRWLNNYIKVEGLRPPARTRGGRAKGLFDVVRVFEADAARELAKEYQDRDGVDSKANWQGYMSTAIKHIQDNLSSEKVEEYTEIAKKWNTQALPRKQQVANQKRHLEKHMRAVAEDVWRRFGGRIVGFVAFKNEANHATGFW